MQLMKYQKIILYYWTGTGNTRRIAEYIRQIIQNSNVEIITKQIGDSCPKTEINSSSNTLLILLTPTHGFTTPWSMIRYLISLPRRKRTHLMTIATRGGGKPGFFIPGLAGSAAILPAVIGILKGYKLRSIFHVDMPHNWISLFPSLKPQNAQHFISKAERKVRSVIIKVVSGKKHIMNPVNLWELLMGIALSPISLLYLLFARYFLAKLFFASEDCTSCGICARNCPHNAIIMRGSKQKKLPYWTLSCESCMRCMNYCPENAIEAGHSIGLLFAYLTSFSVSVYAVDWLIEKLPQLDFIKFGYLLTLLDIPVKVLVIFLTYWIIYYLSKISIFNKLLTYTTLTKVYRRYHEPNTQLKDLRTKSPAK